MGTLEDKLKYLKETKQKIRDAIIFKGQNLPLELPFREYAEKIKNIKTGTDTTDATATADDIIEGTTAYVNEVKLNGAIKKVEKALDYAASENRIVNGPVDFTDINYELKLALAIDNDKVVVYQMNDDDTYTILNSFVVDLNPENHPDRIIQLNDAKFGTAPIIENSEHIVYNIFVAIAGTVWLYMQKGVYAFRYDITTKSLYSDSNISSELKKRVIYYIPGYGKAPVHGTARLIVLSPTEVIEVSKTAGGSWEPGDANIPATIYKASNNILEEVTIVPQTVQTDDLRAPQTGYASYSGRVYVTFTANRQCIASINSSFSSATELKRTDMSYPVLLIDKEYILNDKLYDTNGTIIKEYPLPLFRNNANFKFYFKGFIYELATSENKIYRYTIDEDFNINYDKEFSNQGSINILYDKASVKGFPRNSENTLTLWNYRTNIYERYFNVPGATIITKLIRKGIKYDSENATTITSGNQFLKGYLVQTPTEVLHGAMPNNTNQRIKPLENQEVLIPDGYSKNGLVEAIDPMELRYTKECNKIAENILNNSKIPPTYLSFIQSTNAQWIDTKEETTSDIAIEIKAIETTKQSYYYRFFGGPKHPEFAIMTHYGDIVFRSENKDFMVPNFKSYHLHTYKLTGKGIGYIDGVAVATTAAITSTNGPLYLFRGYDRFSEMKLYYCKIYRDNILIHHLKPARTKQGVVCLYDEITDKYYYNQGSGEFIGGDTI